jgi:hypothetical protein
MIRGPGTMTSPTPKSTFDSVLLEYLLNRCASRFRVIAQPRQHRCHNVLCFPLAHSIACRYGDMGFSTRSNRA